MNAMLNANQSDTKRGEITLAAAADLTGKECYLLKISNNGGVGNFALPAAVTDLAVFVCASGGAQGADTAAECPTTGENCRVKVSAAVVPGGELCLDPNNWGQLYTPAAGSGATNVLFVAEEAGAAGGFVKARFVGPMPKTY
jgi:hypothetical protein